MFKSILGWVWNFNPNPIPINDKLFYTKGGL